MLLFTPTRVKNSDTVPGKKLIQIPTKTCLAKALLIHTSRILLPYKSLLAIKFGINTVPKSLGTLLVQY